MSQGRCNCSVEEAAFDCWRVVNANMTQAVRRLTAEKGSNPQDLTLLAYGGNGPVFAAIQAQELGIQRVLVPRTSPGFSATGALAAQPCIDEERSYIVAGTKADIHRLRQLWRRTGSTRRALTCWRPVSTGRTCCCRYQLNLRYPGQNWSLTVDAAAVQGAQDLSFANDELIAQMMARFHQLHFARVRPRPRRRGAGNYRCAPDRLHRNTQTPFQRRIHSAAAHRCAGETAPRQPRPGLLRHRHLSRRRP